MAVTVRVNKTSVTLRTKLAKQINGDKVRRDKLVRAFKRSDVPKKLEAIIAAETSAMIEVILKVFGGGVTGVSAGVSSVYGVNLTKPWQPLSSSYLLQKRSDSFWFETGDLLNYVRSEVSSLAKKPVQSVKITALPAKKGEKHVPVSMLFTLKRIGEPLQSMIVGNFLQGNYSKKIAAITSSSDLEAYKILVNEQLRSFLPDIAEDFGQKLLSKLHAEV